MWLLTDLHGERAPLSVYPGVVSPASGQAHQALLSCSPTPSQYCDGAICIGAGIVCVLALRERACGCKDDGIHEVGSERPFATSAVHASTAAAERQGVQRLIVEVFRRTSSLRHDLATLRSVGDSRSRQWASAKMERELDGSGSRFPRRKWVKTLAAHCATSVWLKDAAGVTDSRPRGGEEKRKNKKKRVSPLEHAREGIDHQPQMETRPAQ